MCTYKMMCKMLCEKIDDIPPKTLRFNNCSKKQTKNLSFKMNKALPENT